MKKLIVILFMAIGFVFMFLITYMKFQSVEHKNFQETDSLWYSFEEPALYD